MNASLFQDKLAFFMHDGLQAEVGENIFAHSCDLPRVTPEQLIRLRISSFLCSMRRIILTAWGLMCICRLDFRTICAAALNLALGRRVS
ncbi:hypothetical protein [Acinetobacter sp.]|uniref:hypothetical protein n=1 Tax=Acinetobacter sp. TaxID=472 RepID=UPI0035AF8524